MAGAMSRVLLPDIMHSCDVVVAVPTTRSRVRERGYNQAGLIAGSFAEQSRKSCANWLERTPASSSQTTLQPAKRAANVAGAFRISAEARNSIPGARILLIDDVLTTGATVAECTETLAAAGAACVCVLTYARALDTNRLLGSLSDK